MTLEGWAYMLLREVGSQWERGRLVVSAGSTLDLKGLEIGEKGAERYLGEAPPTLKSKIEESVETANGKKKKKEFQNIICPAYFFSSPLYRGRRVCLKDVSQGHIFMVNVPL